MISLEEVKKLKPASLESFSSEELKKVEEKILNAVMFGTDFVKVLSLSKNAISVLESHGYKVELTGVSVNECEPFYCVECSNIYYKISGW